MKQSFKRLSLVQISFGFFKLLYTKKGNFKTLLKGLKSELELSFSRILVFL